VTVSIFDLRGRRVVSLLDARLDVGRHDVAWDGTDASGSPVASGAYRALVRKAEGEEEVGLVLLK